MLLRSSRLATSIAVGLTLAAVGVGATSEAATPATVDRAASATRSAERQQGPGLGLGVSFGPTSFQLECDWTPEMVEAMSPRGVSFGGSFGSAQMWIGVSQRPGAGGTAVLMRIDNEDITWCNDRLVTTAGTGSPYGLLWDGGDRLVIAAVVDSEVTGELRDAAVTGWLSSYSDRNGSRLAGDALIMAAIDASDGSVRHSTFITGEQQTSFQPPDLGLVDVDFEGGGYRVEIQTLGLPRRADGSPMTCSGSPVYVATYVFRADFSTPVVAGSDRCR